MNFRAILQKGLFLAVFILALMAIFDLEEVLAYYNNPEGFLQPSNLIVSNYQTEEIKRIEKEIEKTRTEIERKKEIERISKEIQRIEKEIKRIREAIVLLKIKKEIETIREEITLLEKEIYPEKIRISTREKKKISPEAAGEKLKIEEKIVEEEIVEERSSPFLANFLVAVRGFLGGLGGILSSCLSCWLILILAIYALIKGITAWQQFKKEQNESQKILQTSSNSLV